MGVEGAVSVVHQDASCRILSVAVESGTNWSEIMSERRSADAPSSRPHSSTCQNRASGRNGGNGSSHTTDGGHHRGFDECGWRPCSTPCLGRRRIVVFIIPQSKKDADRAVFHVRILLRLRNPCCSNDLWRKNLYCDVYDRCTGTAAIFDAAVEKRPHLSCSGGGERGVWPYQLVFRRLQAWKSFGMVTKSALVAWPHDCYAMA